MRDLRVRRVNAVSLATVLRNVGFMAEVVNCPHTMLNEGCSDPEHCPQHDSFNNPTEWAGVRTNASGNQAHRVWVQAGLV